MSFYFEYLPKIDSLNFEVFKTENTFTVSTDENCCIVLSEIPSGKIVQIFKKIPMYNFSRFYKKIYYLFHNSLPSVLEGFDENYNEIRYIPDINENEKIKKCKIKLNFEEIDPKKKYFLFELNEFSKLINYEMI